MAVLKEGLGAEPAVLFFKQNGEAIGGVVGFSKRILWVKQFYSSLPYGGVVGVAPPAQVVVRLLESSLRGRGFSRARFVDQPNGGMVLEPPFEAIEGETHVLDFEGRTKEEVWAGFRRNIRRDVRKARRGGVEVMVGLSDRDCMDFYSLYLESMERNRAIPKYSLNFVRAVHRHLCREGRGVLLLARRNTRPIAGILAVDSRSRRHYLMGGSATEGLAWCPNDLLLHTAIEQAIDRGLHSFDFLPSGPGDAKLQRFKAKWGASPQSCPSFDLELRRGHMRVLDLVLRAAGTGPGRRMVKTLRAIQSGSARP
ncbi:MAG: GNAT family N-acetyltransferase [Deltaproteobacteria bacterium]|nr:GNAT family N-acetyltransferase [Deltaproteobacteria bacterium]